MIEVTITDDMLIKAREKAVEMGQNKEKCRAFMQKQRQVCMFLSEDQARSIDRALQVLGTRGMTIFGSSGDGGSHWLVKLAISFLFLAR